MVRVPRDHLPAMMMKHRQMRKVAARKPNARLAIQLQRSGYFTLRAANS
jgi:hypothetical protein